MRRCWRRRRPGQADRSHDPGREAHRGAPPPVSAFPTKPMQLAPAGSPGTWGGEVRPRGPTSAPPGVARPGGAPSAGPVAATPGGTVPAPSASGPPSSRASGRPATAPMSAPGTWGAPSSSVPPAAAAQPTTRPDRVTARRVPIAQNKLRSAASDGRGASAQRAPCRLRAAAVAGAALPRSAPAAVYAPPPSSAPRSPAADRLLLVPPRKPSACPVAAPVPAPGSVSAAARRTQCSASAEPRRRRTATSRPCSADVTRWRGGSGADGRRQPPPQTPRARTKGLSRGATTSPSR